MTDIPAYVFTEDAVVINGTTNNVLLSEITQNININWVYVHERIDDKLKKLSNLIIGESNGERVISGVQYALNKCGIHIYQLFGIDVVIKRNEPYVYRIIAFPMRDKLKLSQKAQEFYRDLIIQIVNILEMR